MFYIISSAIFIVTCNTVTSARYYTNHLPLCNCCKFIQTKVRVNSSLEPQYVMWPFNFIVIIINSAQVGFYWSFHRKLIQYIVCELENILNFRELGNVLDFREFWNIWNLFLSRV